MDIHSSISRNNGPGLYEFLMEAELQHYYSGIRGDLKVQNTAQLKYVTEEDLTAIGMSKPEMRRLKKFFQKHFPQNYLSKFKKMLLSKREDSIPDTLSILSEERPERPPIRVPNKHMIPADAIIVNKELGTGEFGVVQQGVWTNDGERIQVAIKCLSRERMQNNPIEFLKEAAIMHTIDHEHIVRLYGVVLDTNSLMLVTELAPLRSLLECLKEPSLRASFPVSSLCDFAVQIADGMQYLEAKRLIHRDLAARNILVYSKNKVKISDFGLSRALGVGKDYYQTNFNVNLKLPIAWCAPECISYLKFTSASDVWAYGVTLWEMFSYGFQPWAALTGHQIHEAINEPNYQRLEQPDCCPKEHFSLMLNCWQHDPAKRPKFSELISVLPDMKPEQVQAVQDCNEIGQLAYRQGDVITVLDKASNNTMWKGVLNNGKTGFFNPAHTIAYLGSNLPSNKPAEFMRGDGKNAFSSQRRKIRTDMISSPQGDLKHTGHVGLDGAYFGDVSFLAGKYPHLPRQVVTPYKPQEDITDNSSQHLTLERRSTEERDFTRERNCQPSQSDMQNKNDGLWSDACSETSHMETADMMKQSMNSCMMSSTDTIGPDHEYHEISDEENQDSPLRFDKPLSFDFGPSLLDEMDQMFKSLGSSPLPPATNHSLSSEHESSNARNELREMQAKQSSKKKQATVSPINVKPISAADQKTLYSAIAMAQELTARSMTDLEHPLESPRTPASPSRRRKFSFKLPHQHSPKPDRRHFAEEAASIPDIQSLSSTVSSIESLGAPSTLKLPLWDKASAEFCFAKSRELLTKPSAWASYMNTDLEARILDSAGSKQSLAKSTEYLEARNRKSIAGCDQIQNGKLPYENNAPKRVSASYVDRYFEQAGYLEDELDLYMRSVSYLDQEKVNNLERRTASFYSSFQEYAKLDPMAQFGLQNGMRNNDSMKNYGTRPKISEAKMNLGNRASRNSYQDGHQLESPKNHLADAPRTNGQDNYPYVISSNPLFEPEKKEKKDLSQKLLGEKYHRNVSGLESVKNYFESRKEEGLLDLENDLVRKPRLQGLDLFNAAKQELIRQNMHTLEPPKIYHNDKPRTEGKMGTNTFRHRTSSLSETRKQQIRSARNSFHPMRDSSDDSDSISRSETDIRSRLRQRRRHKRMHNMRLNLKSKAYLLHPDSAKTIEMCGKSPPPSTSFLNSLSPPFPSRNNLLSWPESAPSSSLTFTSNSDLDSDTSSEYPEFANHTFPPSPAP